MPRKVKRSYKIIKALSITIFAPINMNEDQLQVDRQYMNPKLEQIRNYAKSVLDEYFDDYRVEIQ